MLVAWTFAPLLGFYMLKGQKAAWAAAMASRSRLPAPVQSRSSRTASTPLSHDRSRVAILLAGVLVVQATIGTVVLPEGPCTTSSR
jgi:multidrug efflux pump subunit AcrB